MIGMVVAFIYKFNPTLDRIWQKSEWLMPRWKWNVFFKCNDEHKHPCESVILNKVASWSLELY